VLIALTDAQVAEVVQDVAGEGLVRSLAGVSDFEELCRVAPPLLDDRKCSRETVRSLLVLVAFPADGSDVELSSVAARVGLSPSTMHRYVYTWRALGLLEQDPLTRRYRRTPVSRRSDVQTGRRQRSAEEVGERL
jgi:hypothetical protein